MNLPNFFFSYKFFRKSGFVRRHTIAQKDFERTCADCRISGEKGFASRLNNSLDWWDKAPFFCAYAKEVLLRVSDDFSFSTVPLSRKRKAVSDRPIHKWNKPSLTADKPGRMILSIRPNTFGQTDKNILPCRWFARFHATGYVLFCWGCLFHGFLFWSFPVQSASTSVYLHFRAFQWAASGSHFRAGCKGNSGIVRESKVKPPVFWKNLQPFG